MRTKDDIVKQLGMTAEYNPRGGIVPDLADVLMIEIFVDIRDLIKEGFDDIDSAINNISLRP